MNTPFNHNFIKQTIGIIFIWLAFQVTSLSQILSNAIGSLAIQDLLTVSIFITLYRATNYIYDHYLWKIFYRNHILSGRWVYALYGLHSQRTVYGTFTFDQTSDNIKIIDGIAWFTSEDKTDQDQKRGDWQGKVIDWTGNRLTIFFEMTSTTLPEDIDRFGEKLEGLFLISYIKTPIKEMQGIFNGIGVQSNRRGPLLMRKVDDDPKQIRKIGLELSKQLKPLLVASSHNLKSTL